MLNGDGNENCKKKINSLISSPPKSTLFCTFLCRCSVHDHNMKLSSYTFYGKKMSYVLTKILLLMFLFAFCSFFFFFFC